MYFLAIPMTISGSLGALFFKKATSKTDKITQLLFSPYFYIGGCLYVIGAILNILLLRFVDYSIAYPMTAITYIWTALFSWKFLKEPLTKNKILGIFMICVGVFILTQ